MMVSHPYKRMMQRCALLFVAGTALHLLFGAINSSFLSYPWGLVLALNYLYLLILLRTNSQQWKWTRHLYNRPAYITSLASMLVLTLLFGLIRQDGSQEGWTGALGWTDMASCWTFNLFLLQFLTAIGLKAIDDIYCWKQRKLPNILMHVSLFIILTSAIFGSGDKIRLRVVAPTGQMVNTGITDDRQEAMLPFAMTLQEFKLEEYPPHIHLYNNGKLSEDYLTIAEAGNAQLLDSWQVECIEYLEYAGRLPEDTLYRAMNHVGATSALHLKAQHTLNGMSAEGWVSCGSHIFDGSSLPLPDGSELVMPRREAKKYLSRIEITDKEGKHTYDVSVNHPATIGAWKIYQQGYDSRLGRWSDISVLECVKDGWYIPIHIAMWMILVGGILMFIRGWNKSSDRKGDKS